MTDKQAIVEVGNPNRNPNSTASVVRSSQYRSNPNCKGFPKITPLSLLNASSGVPSSSTYSSTRIERMLQSRSAFATDVEFEIEASRVHWSELQPSSVVHETRRAEQAPAADEETHLTNAETLERLRKQWPGTKPYFFKDWGDRLEVGEKFAEGAQAEIFEARLAMPDGFPDGGFRCAVKVFKEGTSLHELQRQWPPGMMKQSNQKLLQRRLRHLCVIRGATLLTNGRFAFRMFKRWGDLRKLIDLRMLCNGNRSSPFSACELERNMQQIALGMETLSKCNIVHRDLKASNVLIDPIATIFDPSLIPRDLDVPYLCGVADYECSVGVVGTGFWRAPEILEAVKDRNVTPNLFMEASDVYSFAMTCYEMITGKLPFEDVRLNNYSVVLEGGRPILPSDVKPWIRKLLNRCWHPNPLQRPSFKKIVKFINLQNVGGIRVCRRDVVYNFCGCFRL